MKGFQCRLVSTRNGSQGLKDIQDTRVALILVKKKRQKKKRKGKEKDASGGKREVKIQGRLGCTLGATVISIFYFIYGKSRNKGDYVVGKMAKEIHGGYLDGSRNVKRQMRATKRNNQKALRP